MENIGAPSEPRFLDLIVQSQPCSAQLATVTADSQQQQSTVITKLKNPRRRGRAFSTGTLNIKMVKTADGTDLPMEPNNTKKGVMMIDLHNRLKSIISQYKLTFHS